VTYSRYSTASRTLLPTCSTASPQASTTPIRLLYYKPMKLGVGWQHTLASLLWRGCITQTWQPLSCCVLGDIPLGFNGVSVVVYCVIV